MTTDYPGNGKTIEGLREEIDRIDRQLLELLSQRAETALRIAACKHEKKLPVFDPVREKKLLESRCAANKSALPEAAIRRIFTEIVSACRAIQGTTKVSFLGPEATFTHVAALRHFKGAYLFKPQRSISDVFRDVESGRAQYGVVPAENSIEGGVGMTMDEFPEAELKIRGEVLLPIAHALMSREEDLSPIEIVYSHPQALAQCRHWLAKNLPHSAIMESPSTAAAARRAAEESGAAAIGGEMLAQWHGLNLLATNIQDQAVNLTRFVVLGKEEHPPTGRDKTSIMFMATHQPGSLHQALAPLADAGVNMTRIESRPTQTRPWEYFFLVDFEGHHLDRQIMTALEGLRSNVDLLKIMGSYPMAEVNGIDTPFDDAGISLTVDSDSGATMPLGGK